MKIKDLPAFDYHGVFGDDDPEKVVRLSDLPPRRDAVKDPPERDVAYVIYIPLGKSTGVEIGYCFKDRVWRYEDGEECDPQPTHYSEILHW
jgi:hypothetical protein